MPVYSEKRVQLKSFFRSFFESLRKVEGVAFLSKKQTLTETTPLPPFLSIIAEPFCSH